MFKDLHSLLCCCQTFQESTDLPECKDTDKSLEIKCQKILAVKKYGAHTV